MNKKFTINKREVEFSFIFPNCPTVNMFSVNSGMDAMNAQSIFNELNNKDYLQVLMTSGAHFFFVYLVESTYPKMLIKPIITTKDELEKFITILEDGMIETTWKKEGF